MTESMSYTSFSQLVQNRVLAIGDGYRVKLEELGGDGPYFLRAGALTERGFDWTGLDSFHQEARPNAPAKLGRVGDVVITTKGNSVGRVGWVPEESPDFVYSPHLSYWRSLDHSIVEPRYLYYWSRSEYFVRQLRSLAFSTDMAPYFSLRDQARLKIELPPVHQQRAIAEILGALDDKIAINDRTSSVALDLAHVLYARLLKSKPRTSMSRVLDPILGGTPTRSDGSLWNGSVAWASAKDVTSAEHGVILSTSESITESAASKARTRALPVGTVVLTARGTVGVVARLGTPAAINQSCYGFVPEKIPASCLFFTIKDAANQARSLTHGSVFDTITMNTFEHVQVPMLDQQAWSSVEDQIAPILSSSQQAVSESKALAATRDELLPLLMSRKICVRAAEKIVEGAV